MVEFNTIKRPRKTFRLMPATSSMKSMILRTDAGMIGIMMFILVGLVVVMKSVRMCGNGFCMCIASISHMLDIEQCSCRRFID